MKWQTKHTFLYSHSDGCDRKGQPVRIVSKMAQKTIEVEIMKVKKFIHVANLLKKMGNSLEKSYLRLDLERRVRDEFMSRTMKTWYCDLLPGLKVVSSPPKVSKTTFQDARKLFGSSFDTKVTLRKAGHLGANEEIVILQFDPNFMSTDVVCRHPSCNNRSPEAGKGAKRDLYLCPHHRQVLKSSIYDTLAKNNINIPTSEEKPEHGRFVGYTSLISLLETAYHDAKKFETLKGRSPLVQEAILNVRNFLIITSMVLNPNGDNLELVLPPVYHILRLLLQNPDSAMALAVGLVYVLREVIEMILFAFGVVNTWVSLALQSPGAQIGAGVGGVIGAGGFFLGPWSGAAGVAAGGVLGGLIGNGIYNLVAGDPRQQQIDRFRRDWAAAGGAGLNGQPNNQYPVYYFEGNAFGGLYVHPFPAAQ